jgi:sirohydrochlorin ferrochelatase
MAAIPNHCQRLAENDESEHRDLHRFRLHECRGDGERTLAHRGELQRHAEKLRQRADSGESQEPHIGGRHRFTRHEHHHAKKHHRERKPVEKAHLRRPDRTEARGQRILHRVARRLRRRRDQRREDPEHYSIFDPSLRVYPPPPE